MFKLLIAIIRDSDTNAVTSALVAENFRATRIASTGAFFRQGNTTLIIGVEAEKVDQAIAVIKSACGPAPTDGSRRATFFVLNAARYEQI
ncbi:MAG TPA: cyclic-di-AMP receptor [Anaerolineae bacterium]|nr:cyclic-di-AMP receptor [Anaerolineae bacterium]